MEKSKEELVDSIKYNADIIECLRFGIGVDSLDELKKIDEEREILFAKIYKKIGQDRRELFELVKKEFEND